MYRKIMLFVRLGGLAPAHPIIDLGTITSSTKYDGSALVLKK